METLPTVAKISVNSKYIGESSDDHNVITPIYGRYFWKSPFNEAMTITISKPSYKTITFPLKWGNYTYTTAVVLTKENE